MYGYVVHVWHGLHASTCDGTIWVENILLNFIDFSLCLNYNYTFLIFMPQQYGLYRHCLQVPGGQCGPVSAYVHDGNFPLPIYTTFNEYF